MLRQKKQIGAKTAIWKKRLFRLYAIIAADTGFLSSALEQRKNTTNSKKSKLFKTFYSTVCQLFFNFRTLVRNFLDHWYNFFYSHYFCFTFGRMLQDSCENVLQLLDFSVFGTGDAICYMWKMTNTPLKNQQICFCTFQKFAQFFYKYFYKFWVLADIFCAELIFLTCL